MLEEEAKKIVVPDEPKDADDPSTVTSIQLRFGDGSKLMRKFFSHNLIQDVINYIKKEKQNYACSIRLSTTFPRKQLDDLSKTFKDYGITKSETLNVDLK